MTIKKQFVELVALLEANPNKKVSTMLSKVYELAESKKKDTTYILDAEGNPFAIFCWYHKQWELVNDIPFGSKVSNPTGLNNMCKVGTSKWTKAQRDATKANTDILAQVAGGELEPSKILDRQAEIELARTTMDITDMPAGHTESEVQELLWLVMPELLK